jgi:hypothetical protein
MKTQNQITQDQDQDWNSKGRSAVLKQSRRPQSKGANGCEIRGMRYQPSKHAYQNETNGYKKSNLL